MREALAALAAAAAIGGHPPAMPVAAVGDSITAGSYAPFSWVSELPIWLGGTYIDEAVSGATTESMRPQVPAALAAGAKTVLIMGGSNDVLFGWPPSRSLLNIDGMVREVRAAGAVPVLIGPLPRNNVSAQGLLMLRKGMRRYAAERGIVFIDPWPAFVVKGLRINPTLTAEGVHPNARGAFVLGRIVAHTFGLGFDGD